MDLLCNLTLLGGSRIKKTPCIYVCAAFGVFLKSNFLERLIYLSLFPSPDEPIALHKTVRDQLLVFNPHPWVIEKGNHLIYQVELVILSAVFRPSCRPQ